MRNVLFFALSIVLILAGCGGKGGLLPETLEGTYFSIDYPDGYIARATSFGGAINGGFNTEITAILSPETKLGQVPGKVASNGREYDLANMETMEIGELTGYVADSRMQVAVLIPVDGAIILVNCTSGEKPEDFEKYVEPMLKTLKITKTSGLDSVTKLEKTEAKPKNSGSQTTVDNTAKDVTQNQSAIAAIGQAKKGLRSEQYFETDRLFVRLPFRYVVKSNNSDNLSIKYMSPDPKLGQEILIQFFQDKLNPEKILAPESGSAGIEEMNVGDMKYWMYRRKNPENKQILVLMGTTPSGTVRLTVTGSQGLEGENGNLLKSIIYK